MNQEDSQISTAVKEEELLKDLLFTKEEHPEDYGVEKEEEAEKSIIKKDEDYDDSHLKKDEDAGDSRIKKDESLENLATIPEAEDMEIAYVVYKSKDPSKPWAIRTKIPYSIYVDVLHENADPARTAASVLDAVPGAPTVRPASPQEEEDAEMMCDSLFYRMGHSQSGFDFLEDMKQHLDSRAARNPNAGYPSAKFSLYYTHPRPIYPTTPQRPARAGPVTRSQTAVEAATVHPPTFITTFNLFMTRMPKSEYVI